MHLYVICGHGAGDPGACGNGYSEAERVRALGARIAELGGTSVTLLDTNRNWYADRGINGLSIPSGDALVELHMDSASPDAHGGHVIIKAGIGGPDSYDRALADSISTIFPGRSQSIVERSDLANPNRAAARGINYRLVENGFITNAHDVETFNSRLDDIAGAYLAAFGIEGGEAPAAPEEAQAPASTGSSGMPDGALDFPEDPLLYDGYFGPATAKQVQLCLRAHGLYSGLVDGDFGPMTKRAFQRYLANLGYYSGLIDGDFGPMSVRALQSYLIDRGTYWDAGYGWCDVDGDWGSLTTIGLQRAINGNRL
jgi:peptidoglycan hydrolase-like protein with peptidoglycan-binding domain